MKNKLMTIKQAIKDDNISFDKFYDTLSYNEIGYWDEVNHTEIIKDYIKDMIDKDLVEAQQAKERAEQLEAELKVKYDAAKIEIQKLLKEAEAQGNLRKEEIINEAKLEATRRLTMAQEEIEREIAQQEDDLKNQIISIAFLAAEKIVGREIDQQQYIDAVTKIIESGIGNE